jgi:hypothetical protein
MSGFLGKETTFFYSRVINGLLINKEVHDEKCTSLF